MNKIAALALLLAIGAPAITPAAASDLPMCLRSYFIDRTTVVDPKTILFRMKDGKVWRNTMRASCTGLRFNGFVYVTPDDEICRSQAIRVLNSGQVCALGNFTPEPGRQG